MFWYVWPKEKKKSGIPMFYKIWQFGFGDVTLGKGLTFSASLFSSVKQGSTTNFVQLGEGGIMYTQYLN